MGTEHLVADTMEVLVPSQYCKFYSQFETLDPSLISILYLEIVLLLALGATQSIRTLPFDSIEVTGLATISGHVLALIVFRTEYSPQPHLF
jgi:hypothetical protein